MRGGRVALAARRVLEIGVAGLAAAILAPEAAEFGILVATAAVGLALGIVAFLPPSILGSLGRSKVLRAADVVVFNLCLTAVLLEGGIALLARFSSSPVLVQVSESRQDAISRTRGKPGELHHGFPFNSLGYFDTEFERERVPGLRRIVALGDSFAVGIVPYPRHFLVLVEEALDRVEVLNFGIAATEPQEYLFLYATEARHYSPDLVLVCVFVGNDITTYKDPPFLEPERWYLFTVPSRIATILAEARRRGVGLEEVGEAAATGGGEAYHDDPSLEEPTFSDQTYLEVEEKRIFACHVKRQREFEDTFDLLRRLRDATGDRMAIALIPDEFQVEDELWEAIFRAYPILERRKFDRERPQREFDGFCREEGIPLLDLLPAMRQAADEIGRPYHRNDSHWNAIGNRVAARELALWLGGLFSEPK